MYQALYKNKENGFEIMKNGTYWFSIPVAVSVNEQIYEPGFISECNGVYTFGNEYVKMSFHCVKDSIIVDFTLRTETDTPIYKACYFKGSAGGLEIQHFNKSFCPQPRRNDGYNMDFYKNLPDCSMNGYFYPSITNFSVGNDLGWVSFGLLDLPDSYHYKLQEDLSILTESCGGNKVIKAGETYHMPQMLITFPKDEWDGIRIFRQKLIEYGKYGPSKKKLSECPTWWRNPLVCTYGDELSTLKLDDWDMNSPEFNADWVRMLVDTAEQKWGIRHMNIVLDAFWQLQFALDPKADEKRFGNMRDFVEEMHERGHHVIAWITPVFDSVANGFVTRSQKLDILSDTAIDPLGIEGSFIIDMTSDNIEQYYSQVCQTLLGNGEGDYNFDGVKMDYMALIRDPEKHGPYRHPEKGLGMREMKLFLEAFYKAAKGVKADALINCSVTDPRVEHLIDMNRLHDTHAGTIEKEMRACVASTACPDLLIDSDGALMYTDWAKHHYICAAVYSTPSNYYTLKYHDRAMEERDLKPLGTLLQMAVYKPDGQSVMESFGNWKLIDSEGKVNAQTIDGHTVIYYPWAQSEKGYIFTWRNETVIIPLHGRKFGKLNMSVKGYQVDYARDQVIIRLEPGKLYTFENIDENNSISQLFQKRISISVDVEYANG